MVEKVLYVARDRDNTLCIYGEEPIKNSASGVWMSQSEDWDVIINGGAFPSYLFKGVSWSDDEPRKLKITMEDTK